MKMTMREMCVAMMTMMLCASAIFAQATKPAPPAPAPANFDIGGKVQVKWGGLWRDAIVKNKGNGWVLVNYTPGKVMEWVEPWRLRAVGSKDDSIGYAKPGKSLMKAEAPPAEKPGAAPAEEKAAPPVVAPSAGEAGSAKMQAPEIPEKQAVRAGVKAVDVSKTPLGWKVNPDATTTQPAKPLGIKPIALTGATGEFFENTDALLFAAPQAMTAVVVHLNEPPGQPGRERVERIDLSAGTSLGAVEMPVIAKALDLSPDGKWLLTRSTGSGFGGEGRLDIWQIDAPGGAAKQVVSFRPYADVTAASSQDVKWAKFVSATRVATINGDGKLLVWDVPAARAVWMTTAAQGSTPAASPGGKQIAVTTDKDIVMLDAEQGTVLARMTLKITARWSKLSFRPDGVALAAVDQDAIRIWDVRGGQLVHESTPTTAWVQSLDWISNGYLLIGDQLLVDVAKSIPLWRYTRERGGIHSGAASFGGRYWFVEKGRSSGEKPVLASVMLPDEAAKQAAATVRVEDLFAVQPRTKVSLEVGNVADAPKVTESLKAKLAANGFVVTPQPQPIKLVATMESGKSEEVSYRGFGAAENTKMSVTEQISRVAFLNADGKSLWQREAHTAPPPMLMLKEGQTIEQAVADAMKPSAAFFMNVVIPQRLMKLEYKDGLGTSRLTAAGIVPAKSPRPHP